MKNITLLKDNVLIRLIHEEASAGGIILSNAHHMTKPHRVGTVLAVGPKADLVKPDDRVILDFGGHYTKWNGDDEVVAVRQQNILGVIE